jgi:hypothetical protein
MASRHRISDMLKPPKDEGLRINLRLQGKAAQAVREAMDRFDVDAPTAIRILIAEARDGKRVAN